MGAPEQAKAKADSVDEAAISYGQRLAASYFKGRKGHGGGDVGKVVLDSARFAAIAALAYDAGLKAGRRGL